MSYESMNIVKNSSEQLKIKRKQLSTLQIKEAEETAKVVIQSQQLEQEHTDYEICMRSYLASNVSEQELKASKAKIKELSDSLQETKETISFISETRAKLMSEISYLDGDRTVHRAILCAKLASEGHDEMAANKKLKEKLVAGYAAFMASGDYDRSWIQHLVRNFPVPSEHEIQLAVNKFKQSNEFMQE